MGCSISPVVANLAVTLLDRQIEALPGLVYYGRYVDDIILAVENTENVQCFDAMIAYLKKYIAEIAEEYEGRVKVCKVNVDEQEELVCVGFFPGADEGQNLEINGDYINHPVYGREFKAVSFKEITPKDEQGIIRYLSSGAIKGIGDTLAARIVKKFGTQTFDIMEKEPERLAEIKGISLRIAQEIAIQIVDKKSMRDAFIFLEQYGISNNLAAKIYEKYGEGLYAVIRENPYKLAEDISGIGFRTSDEIADKLGIQKDFSRFPNPERFLITFDLTDLCD